MKNIEIATAHNIVFKYELASLAFRCLAYAIDLVVLAFYWILGALTIGSNSILYYIFIGLGMSLYHLLFEIFNRGQSPGKMILKLRVVTLQGTTPSLNDYFIRWVFRMVDITFSAGVLALFNIAGSPRNQRIGDLLAQTSVISLRNTQAISLKSLSDLNNLKHEIKYPGLRQFNDADMLLLKNAITRFQLSKTPENKMILSKIGTKILEALDIEIEPNLKVQFLRELLNEYVIITR